MAPDVEELEAELPELDGRNRLQGTATCLPELDDDPEIPDEVEEEVLDDDVPELEPELFKDTIAKSILPAFALMITS
jgi:hypothetical protein